MIEHLLDVGGKVARHPGFVNVAATTNLKDRNAGGGRKKRKRSAALPPISSRFWLQEASRFSYLRR